MSNDQTNQPLKQKFRAKNRLTLDDARKELPAFIAAELAGEDVDASFVQLTQALDDYPELAEEYYLLMEELQAELQDEAPLPAPATTPSFLAPQKPDPAKPANRVFGQIFSLIVRPLSYSKGLDQVILCQIEAAQDFSDVIAEASIVRNDGNNWQLVLKLHPGQAGKWNIAASIKDQLLPVLEKKPGSIAYDLLDHSPLVQISLDLQPL